ncbi:prothrombin-like isoform X2 [Prorops nasuta]|uniref:prothrombin-like isoform X2 n=1 Tax=Prorops nasuta TaxID=863751 RepID=UPI0034CD60DC
MLYLLRMIDPIEETSEGLHNAFSTSGKHLSYMAAIINNDANFICNGVLVSDRFVLTAAKCIYPHMLNPYSHLTVITGTHLYDIEQNNVNNQTFTKSEILKVYLTAKWSKNLDKRNHIVLIKLAAPIPITEKQKPISLPEKPPPDNVYGLVTGWGTFGENYTTSSSLNYLHQQNVVGLGISLCW